MSATVQVGGEEIRIADFSAFKAIYALAEVSAMQGVWRQVLDAGATFKREYEAAHYVEIDRAHARQRFAPRVLLEDAPLEADGKVVVDIDGVPLLRQVPMLRDGQPVMGPDPLAHLSEQDWHASGHKLRVPDSPETMLEVAAMIEAGFRLARPQVIRLLALATTPNADLEKWDTDGGDATIAAQLDDAGRRLVYRASVAELVHLAIAVVELMRAQLADPFDAAREAIKAWRPKPGPTAPQPMTVETIGDAASPPTSSTDSPTDTDGIPEPSSTEQPGISSTGSVTASAATR